MRANSCWPTFPGLIEGASEGVGLGDRFLSHVERCRVLLHLVEGTSEHAGEAYKTVRHEIEAYGHGLAEKPEIVALSKADALDEDTLKEQLDEAEAGLRSGSPMLCPPPPDRACRRCCRRCLP